MSVGQRTRIVTHTGILQAIPLPVKQSSILSVGSVEFLASCQRHSIGDKQPNRKSRLARDHCDSYANDAHHHTKCSISTSPTHLALQAQNLDSPPSARPKPLHQPHGTSLVAASAVRQATLPVLLLRFIRGFSPWKIVIFPD